MGNSRTGVIRSLTSRRLRHWKSMTTFPQGADEHSTLETLSSRDKNQGRTSGKLIIEVSDTWYPGLPTF